MSAQALLELFLDELRQAVESWKNHVFAMALGGVSDGNRIEAVEHLQRAHRLGTMLMQEIEKLIQALEAEARQGEGEEPDRAA